MKLGIPTLCRYDLLERLINSAELGSQRPTSYIIVDNGLTLDQTKISALLGDRVEFVVPDANLGVAASWNLIIDRASPEPVVIANDDIVFNDDTFSEMANALDSGVLFVEGDGWALFGQRRELLDQVGYYDENFWPAYYEDVDYDLRLARADVPIVRPLSRPVEHVGWATTTAIESAGESWLRDGREHNHAYFLAKWGGESRNPRWNGTADIEHYAEPFNGRSPVGWDVRRRVVSVVAMHWDVLNYIARRVGARRYLEIGVEAGECMKRIEVPEKWGVDPDRTLGAVQAADVFVGKKSEDFFREIAPHVGKFDLVFIDGDHDADVVYREVEDAMGILSPKGVVCLHDVNPLSESMQEMPWRPGLWTGNVWKAVARLRNEAKYLVRTVPFDYGMAVVFPGEGRAIRQVALPCTWDRLKWSDLVSDREQLLGLLDANNWMGWIDREVCR